MVWIKIEDGLPEYGEDVILCSIDSSGKKSISIDMFYKMEKTEKTYFGSEVYEYLKPICWMPLPKQPED